MKKVGKIFISYRRADSFHETSRIWERLIARFGPEQVFRDVHSIRAGEDFPERLKNEVVSLCDVFIVVIGRSWLNICEDDHKTRRLDNPEDWVRIEIETALRLKKCLIPVLVSGAVLPQRHELPSSLQELANKNKAEVRNDPDFNNDVNRLIKDVEKHFIENSFVFVDSRNFVERLKPKREKPGPLRWLGSCLCGIVAFYFLFSGSDFRYFGFFLFIFCAYLAAYT